MTLVLYCPRCHAEGRESKVIRPAGSQWLYCTWPWCTWRSGA